MFIYNETDVMFQKINDKGELSNLQSEDEFESIVQHFEKNTKNY